MAAAVSVLSVTLFASKRSFKLISWDDTSFVSSECAGGKDFIALEGRDVRDGVCVRGEGTESVCALVCTGIGFAAKS